MSKSDTFSLAARGDREALLELMLDCQGELGRFVDGQIGTSARVHFNSDDILQETFVSAFRSVSSLRATDRIGFFAWLKQIATNRIRDAARKEATAKRGGNVKRIDPAHEDFGRSALDLVSEIADPAAATASTFAARREAIDAMHVALALLPDDQREAIRLHCFERLSLKLTAAQMERSYDSICGLVQRAKQSLRESLHTSSKWLSKKH